MVQYVVNQASLVYICGIHKLQNDTPVEQPEVLDYDAKCQRLMGHLAFDKVVRWKD